MSPYPRLMSLNLDPSKFEEIMKSLVEKEGSKVWEFDEKGDVLPENQERYDNLMAEWEEWEDEAVLEDWDDEPGWDEDDMDGDWDSGMTSAGWGTDEDYGYYGEDF